MKRSIMTALTVFFIVCILEGCSRDNKFIPSEQKLLVFSSESEQVGAYILKIDFDKQIMELDSNPIYVIPVIPSTTEDLIFPQYISRNNLILRDNPTSFSNYDTAQVSTDDNRLYFEEYILEVNKTTHTFQLIQADETIASDIGLVYDNRLIMPCSFFVDDEGVVAILGMTSESLSDTDMVTALYINQGATYQVENFTVYDDMWDAYDLSKVNCPNYHSYYTNVIVNQANNSFLYNETAKLLEISPYSGTLTCILDEKDIAVAMPFVDTHRDFYGFFSGFYAHNGNYIATFPAYNSLAGTYAAFYTKTGEYLGYVLCSEDKIILGDENNKRVDEVAGDFSPKIFVIS